MKQMRKVLVILLFGIMFVSCSVTFPGGKDKTTDDMKIIYLVNAGQYRIKGDLVVADKYISFTTINDQKMQWNGIYLLTNRAPAPVPNPKPSK